MIMKSISNDKGQLLESDDHVDENDEKIDHDFRNYDNDYENYENQGGNQFLRIAQVSELVRTGSEPVAAGFVIMIRIDKGDLIKMVTAMMQ